MPDNKGIKAFSNRSLPNKLHICLFPARQPLAQSCTELLTSGYYHFKGLDTADEFIEFVSQNKKEIDCILFINDPAVNFVLDRLWELEVLLPIIIVEVELAPNAEINSDNSQRSLSTAITSVATLYHKAEVHLDYNQLEPISSYINLAIAKFLNLAPSCNLSERATSQKLEQAENNRTSLVSQQRRLADKLKERLGYLGVYYKRNPQEFYRNLSSEKKAKLSQQLVIDYRQIILSYFTENAEINQYIDRFVDRAFFADISISHVLEIHMDLMDEFAQQLKIEGRNDDILLDYRLTLIDVIAHLCEMYRRSIPREDISLETII